MLLLLCQMEDFPTVSLWIICTFLKVGEHVCYAEHQNIALPPKAPSKLILRVALFDASYVFFMPVMFLV